MPGSTARRPTGRLLIVALLIPALLASGGAATASAKDVRITKLRVPPGKAVVTLVIVKIRHRKGVKKPPARLKLKLLSRNPGTGGLAVAASTPAKRTRKQTAYRVVVAGISVPGRPPAMVAQLPESTIVPEAQARGLEVVDWLVSAGSLDTGVDVDPVKVKQTCDAAESAKVTAPVVATSGGTVAPRAPAREVFDVARDIACGTAPAFGIGSNWLASLFFPPPGTGEPSGAGPQPTPTVISEPDPTVTPSPTPDPPPDLSCTGGAETCTATGATCDSGSTCTGAQSNCTGTGTTCTGPDSACSAAATCTGPSSDCTGAGTTCGEDNGSTCVAGAECHKFSPEIEATCGANLTSRDFIVYIPNGATEPDFEFWRSDMSAPLPSIGCPGQILRVTPENRPDLQGPPGRHAYRVTVVVFAYGGVGPPPVPSFRLRATWRTTGTLSSSAAATCDGPLATCTGANATCTGGATCVGSSSTCRSGATCWGSDSACNGAQGPARCEGPSSDCVGAGALCARGDGPSTCTAGGRCTQDRTEAVLLESCPGSGTTLNVAINQYIPNGVTPDPPTVWRTIPQPDQVLTGAGPEICPGASQTVTAQNDTATADPADPTRHRHRTLFSIQGVPNPGTPNVAVAATQVHWRSD